MSRRKGKKQIAPRLADGSSRLHYGGGLPDYVKLRLRTFADQQGLSMSWLLERRIVEYLAYQDVLKMRPRYVKPKPVSATTKRGVKR